MNKLSINIDMDNAAFEPDWRLEAGRILRNLANAFQSGMVPAGSDSMKLLDINGNSIGAAEWEEE